MPIFDKRLLEKSMRAHDLAVKFDRLAEEKGYAVSRVQDTYNIVYVEGMSVDFLPLPNILDGWNDLGLVISYKDNVPRILSAHQCTTGPGLAATNSEAARALGGVARIGLGEHLEIWEDGFHKGRADHPALVQRAPLFVYRDLNKDGERIGDPYRPASGINQHSTRPGWAGEKVGMWSAGCLVRRFWNSHILFLSLIRADARRAKKQPMRYSTWVVDKGMLSEVS